MDHATPRLRVLLSRSIWLLPLGTAVLAIPFTVAAWQTGFDLRADDPCASGWDNAWSLASSAALWAAVVTCGICTVSAIRRKRVGEASLGVVALALIMMMSVICWVYANGGYGWHCPYR
jgi:hypothetical protein